MLEVFGGNMMSVDLIIADFCYYYLLLLGFILRIKINKIMKMISSDFCNLNFKTPVGRFRQVCNCRNCWKIRNTCYE